MKKFFIYFLAVIFFAGMVGVSFAQADLAAKVKDSMTSLKDKLAKLGEPKADGMNLSFGATKINGNYAIVDELKESNGCTATVFVKKGEDFIRVSTNVVKEGNRAVGTNLDAAGKAYAALLKGESYYGQVDVLGTMFEAGYEPLKSGNDVVGAYYIGFKLDK